MTKYIKWPCDWNRPLSREERQIAARLANAPDKAPYEPMPTREFFNAESPGVAETAEGWHREVSEKQDAAQVVREEEGA